MHLDEKIIISLQESQLKSIQAKQLVQEQLDIIYAHNWFNLWVPSQLNGLDYSLLDGFNLIKELAYVDGGLAWAITLCSGANMFAGYINTQVASQVFNNPRVCFGGSGRANGKAIFDGENYSLSGIWNYATGAPHLTHFTLNAYIYDKTEQRFDEDSNPVIYSFFVPREDVLIHYDWDTFGLECTASHSFSLDNVKIPATHAFQLIPEYRKIDNTIYKIPFLTFAELTLLPNYLGMYKRFLDLVEKYYFKKSKDPYWADKYSKIRFRQVDKSQQQLEFFIREATTIIATLEQGVDEEVVSDNLLKEITQLCRNIVKEIKLDVVSLFSFVGIAGAQRDNEINIVFRNLFTASQHNLLNTDI